MRTQVFAYKGFVGIKSDFKAEGLLNKPDQPGQLGFVVDAAFVDISPEALEILKKIPRSGDDIGEVDVFGDDKGKVIFCWLGGNMKVFSLSDKVDGSSTYDATLLKANPNVIVDPKFIAFVDKEKKSKKTKKTKKTK
jgi:hypothetical protein